MPTLLYLTTGVIRETAIRTDNDVSKTGSKTPVHAALHCLRTLTVNKYSRDSRSQQKWTSLLQSALAKIIDLAKTGKISPQSLQNMFKSVGIKYYILLFNFYLGSDETKMDEVAMMLGIAVFVLNALPGVVSAPNLQFPCINHFRQAIQSENILVSCI